MNTSPLGQIEFAVLNAVHGGALQSPRKAQQIRRLREQPGGEAALYDVLHRCEHRGLLRSSRDPLGRHYELTAAGRARLRADRRFRAALASVLVRSYRDW